MQSNETNGSTEPVPVIIFGEVLFDCFPDDRRILGGAPFNVAWSLSGFGRKPLFVSAVGDDPEGREITARMQDWGMPTDGLQRDGEHATGEVRVTFEGSEPSYEILANRAWDHVGDEGKAAGELLYHGLLALRSETSRKTLHAMIERSPGARFFDINLRPPHDDWDVLKKYLQGVDWLKLNIDELQVLLDETDIPLADSRKYLDRLMKKHAVRNVVLTGGKAGAIIHGESGSADCLPAPEPDPFVDTVGAGDAFSAATIDGILAGRPMEEIVRTASAFAAKVCGLRGATTNDRQFYTQYHA